MTVLLLVFAAFVLATPAMAHAWGRRVFVILAAVPAAAAVWTACHLGQVRDGGALTQTHPWIPQLGMEFSFRLDALSWVMAMVVSVVGALVLLYCAWYFTDSSEGLGRFASLLLSFAGVMFGLVLSDDVIIMFVFWEATSVLSYLLIGHFTGRRESRGAALQALLVTTFGGLAMFVGIVMLATETGTTSLARIVAAPPDLHSAFTITAVMLILVGAASKSALVPFHFWLPSAMAAPTPVSAYLHAAAMVKAGIYLVARLAPGFAPMPGWRESLVSLGVFTMIIGGWRSLRQTDLKLLLAYGTVSQLGFLTVVLGFGNPDVALGGMTLLVAHAAFKATLFLVVGIIDHDAGTRDVRELSGVGRSRPILGGIAIVAAASMAGLPPLVGFVAKEAVLSTLLDAVGQYHAWAWVALVGVVIGSVLTVAYSVRFVWGALWTKHWLGVTVLKPTAPGIMVAPAALALFSVIGGLVPAALGTVFAPYAASFGAAAHYHLALWHGLEASLGITVVVVLAGLGLFLVRAQVMRAQLRLPRLPDAARGYWAVVRAVDRTGLASTRLLQRRGLPGYLTMILLVFVVSVVAVVGFGGHTPGGVVMWDHPLQLVVALIMCSAAVASAMVGQRITAVLLVGMTGYGMVALFGFHGAPDLALTQALVETVTLVVFVLVLRRLPGQIAQRHRPTHRIPRALLGIAVGAAMAAVAVISLGSRSAEPISTGMPELAEVGGHGKNVVNVILVDIRAWDTMGEISVLVAVATGVASLLFVTGREGHVQRMARNGVSRRERRRAMTAQTVLEPVQTAPVTVIGAQAFTTSTEADVGFSAGEDRAPTRRSWLLAGRTLSAANRSILLEVLVRLLFHPAIVVSIYLLLVGHNAPGGGFTGGLLAGLAIAARYLAGGRYELGEAVPIDAGWLLGGGILLAAGTAASSLVMGMEVLQSSWFEGSWGPFAISMGTATIFDIGVYLVVLGVVLDILRSLGAQVDRHQDDLVAAREGSGRSA